jgi:hypothetical protein
VSDERRTDELVARLAAGLPPVRPVAALHRQALAVGAAWLATAAFAAAWLGVHPLDVTARGPVWASLVGALALVGAAGLLLGLASRIPGRERAAWLAAALAGVGLAGVLGDGLALGDGRLSTPFAECAGCYAKALLLAVPVGLVAGLLARRAAPLRPALAGVAVALGAAAAGGLVVHLGCRSPDPSHWLLGHALAPLGTGALVGLAAAYTGRMPRFFAGSWSSGRAR